MNQEIPLPPSAAGAACDVVLERLMTLHPKVIDLSLGRVERLLGLLGHPETKLPPVVHVAGTNGKGSVIAYLRAMLEAGGYGVHVHISPHLVRFNERIRLAGELIPDADLLAILEECEDANGGEPITYFEITTAAALLAFSRSPADVLLLETGLGGRLDATNVVERPLLTVITPVSLDHQQFLGETIAEITQEKAGILRPRVPCVVGRQPAEAFAAIDRRAAELNVPLIAEDRDWAVDRQTRSFRYQPEGPQIDLSNLSLPGDHQLSNAGQALACLDAMAGFSLTDAQIKQGFASAAWPARLQRLRHGPLVDALPKGWELWLDGGHNEAAASIIADHARAAWADAPVHLVCGMLNSKDPEAFLGNLAGVAASLHTVAIPGEPNTLSAEDLAAAGRKVGLDGRPAPSVAAALAEIINYSATGTTTPGRVLICGSLYLAGQVLGRNG